MTLHWSKGLASGIFSWLFNRWQGLPSLAMPSNFDNRFFFRIATQSVAIFLVTFLVALNPAHAGSANPEPNQIAQPDGTTFQAVMRGDEFQGWMESEDGYTIIKNSVTGFFEYASQDAGGGLIPSGILITDPNVAQLAAQSLLPPKGLRPQSQIDLELYQNDFLEGVRAQRGAIGSGASLVQTGTWAPTPVTGSKKILVILVNFANASLYGGSSSSTTYWNNAVHNASAASVTKYYQDNSFGHIAVSPVATTQPGGLTGFVTVSLAQNHPNCGGSCSYATETAWVNSALAAAAPYVNFAALDTNGDGTISVDEALIYFVLAGYETSAGSGLTPSIWAHAWGGSGVTAGGKAVNHWALNGEMYNASTQMKMGVIAHEMGHAMGGLPDLYDINGKNLGLGIFSVMAFGSWGRLASEIGGATPVGFDAWSRQYLGWSTPQSAVNGTFSFVSGQSSPSSALMLMNSSVSTSEYWLVENRPPLGWDAGMYQYMGTWTGGLLVQHIDLNIGTKSANSFNAYVVGSHQGNMAEEPSTALCSLKAVAPAVSSKGCPTILYYLGNSTAFNPASTPSSNYYNGAVSDLGVSAISAAGASMSGTVTTGGVPGRATLVSPSVTSSNPPTYVWNAVSNATWYQLWVNGAGTWYTASQAHCGAGTGTCSIAGGALTAGSSYTWWVQTYNSSVIGEGPWSAGMSFTVTGPPGPPTLVSPSGTSSNPPTYVWNAVSNATWYQLWVNGAGTWYTASQAHCGAGTGTCSIAGGALTAGSSYTWWVQTYNSYGEGPWSAGMTFTPGGTTGANGTYSVVEDYGSSGNFYAQWVIRGSAITATRSAGIVATGTVSVSGSSVFITHPTYSGTGYHYEFNGTKSGSNLSGTAAYKQDGTGTIAASGTFTATWVGADATVDYVVPAAAGVALDPAP
jgi:M6 family metalloprotease-like protein